jgi:type I restriction enzyme S subunit
VVIRATDFDSLDHDDVATAPRRFLRFASMAQRRLLPGDLLVEMSGGSEAQPTGRIALVSEAVAATTPPVVFSNFVKRIRLTPAVDAAYFALAWRDLYDRGKTRPYEKRTTGIRNFKLDDFLASERMPLPPINEQRRIAQILLTIQRAGQASDDTRLALGEFKRAVVAAAFARAGRSTSLEMLIERPQYGLTASASERPGVRFLRITDLRDYGVDWDVVPSCDPTPPNGDRYVLYDGDLVVARIGATTGKAWLVRDPPLAVFASYLIRLRARRCCDPRFLAAFFDSAPYWQQIQASKGGRLKGGVNIGNLNALEVPLLTADAQQTLGDHLDRIGLAADAARRKRDAVERVFRSARSKLLSAGL